MNLLPQRIRITSDEDVAQQWSPQSQMAIAMGGMQIYRGTVPAHVKAKRRAKNKAARLARRASR